MPFGIECSEKGMVTLMKKISALLLATVLLLSFASCGKGKDKTIDNTGDNIGLSASPSAVPSPDTGTSAKSSSSGSFISMLDQPEDKRLSETLLTVGDYEVSFGLYRFYYQTLKSRMLANDPDSFATEAGYKTLKEQTLEQCRIVATYFNMAKELKMTVRQPGDDDFKNYVRDLEKKLAAYNTTLADRLGDYQPLSVYNIFYILDNSLSEDVFKAVGDEKYGLIDFSQEAVAKAGEEYRTVKHILVGYTDNLSDEEALNLAGDIIKRYKAGESFDDMMKEYSNDYHEGTSNVYTFTKGEMVKEFEECSFSMEVNSISEPVKSQFGYHVILRLPLSQDFKDKYISMAVGQYLDKRFQDWEVKTTPQFDSLTDEALK